MSIRVMTAAVIAFLTGIVPAAMAIATDPEPPVCVSFVESSRSHASTPPVTAIGLRHAGLADAIEPAATDVLVLFDTSAS